MKRYIFTIHCFVEASSDAEAMQLAKKFSQSDLRDDAEMISAITNDACVVMTVQHSSVPFKEVKDDNKDTQPSDPPDGVSIRCD